MFLVKLKSNLKMKILNIDSVSNTRDKLLTIIIMQEQTLNRTREIDASNFNNYRVTKDFDVFLSKSY